MAETERARADFRRTSLRELGRLLKAHGKRSGIKQGPLSRRLGLKSDRFIQVVHKGQKPPSRDLLGRWIKALRVPDPDAARLFRLLDEIQLRDRRHAPKSQRVSDGNAGDYEADESSLGELVEFLQTSDVNLGMLDVPLRRAVVDQLKGHISAWADMVRKTVDRGPTAPPPGKAGAREGPPLGGGYLGAARPRRRRAGPD